MTKNKTIVKPLSNHMFVYTKQPTTKNTKPGDIVLYKKDLWLNDGNNVIPMSLTKNYVDEKVEKTLKENNMNNYIVINGKKAELTEEQLEALGIKKRNNPFNNKLEDREIYYYNDYSGTTDKHYTTDMRDCINLSRINSFNDGDFADQVYLHELLNRKLLKYAWDNNAEDCEWDNNNTHYYIYFDSKNCNFKVDLNTRIRSQNIYFSKKNVAEQAIKDIVEPFMERYPNFVW